MGIYGDSRVRTSRIIDHFCCLPRVGFGIGMDIVMARLVLALFAFGRSRDLGEYRGIGTHVSRHERNHDYWESIESTTMR
jgi:hypothetical protein